MDKKHFWNWEIFLKNLKTSVCTWHYYERMFFDGSETWPPIVYLRGARGVLAHQSHSKSTQVAITNSNRYIQMVWQFFHGFSPSLWVIKFNTHLWALEKVKELRLTVFERKILRIICGSMFDIQPDKWEILYIYI